MNLSSKTSKMSSKTSDIASKKSFVPSKALYLRHKILGFYLHLAIVNVANWGGESESLPSV